MRRWNCGRGVGICALALGVGILIAAIFPVGCLMFIVAFLLIACGLCCLRQCREGRKCASSFGKRRLFCGAFCAAYSAERNRGNRPLIECLQDTI